MVMVPSRGLLRIGLLAATATSTLFPLGASPATAPSDAERGRAQQPIAPQYTIQTRVPITILDVTVTDAKGNPVHGLKQSDFTVLEDGNEMSPNSFVEHRSDDTPQPIATLVKQTLPPNTFTNQTSAPTDRPINILLLDNLNTPPQMQQQVTQRLLDFVNKMKPGTLVAVFRLTTRLAIVQGFTSDQELLKAALRSKNNFAWSSPVRDGDCGEDSEIEGQCSVLQAQYTLSAMRQIARYVYGSPGRKNLIWFSGSFPLEFPPVTDPIAFPGTTSKGSIYDLSDEMKAATDLMARAHIALYPIDWRGPKQLTVDPHTYSGFTNGGNMLFAERGTMQDIADQTGGKFFFNTNDYAGSVEQAIDNGSNFYTIAYEPANQALDTRFRKISVKVDRPGLNLDYRNGYYAVGPTTDSRGIKIEKVSPMQTALMRGALDATQILFRVKAREAPGTEISLPTHNEPNPKQMKPPYRHYSINYNIDINGIGFTASPDGNYRAAFEFGIRVYNADGDEIVNSASKEVHAALTPAVYRSMLKTGANAHDEIDVPAKGNYVLRIGVHDLTTDRVGALEIPASSIKIEPAPAPSSASIP